MTQPAIMGGHLWWAGSAALLLSRCFRPLVPSMPQASYLTMIILAERHPPQRLQGGERLLGCNLPKLAQQVIETIADMVIVVQAAQNQVHISSSSRPAASGDDASQPKISRSKGS